MCSDYLGEHDSYLTTCLLFSFAKREKQKLNHAGFFTQTHLTFSKVEQMTSHLINL